MASKRSRTQPRRPTIVRRDTAAKVEVPAWVNDLKRATYSNLLADLLLMVGDHLALIRQGEPLVAGGPVLTESEMIGTLIGIDSRPSTATLTVLKELVDDHDLQKRIASSLEARHHKLPTWVEAVSKTHVTDACGFRDGSGRDTLYIELTIAGGVFCLGILTDPECSGTIHSLMLSLTPAEEYMAITAEHHPQRLDLASLPPRLKAIIDAGAATCGVQLDDDYWPASDTLLRWTLRLLAG